MIRFSDPVTILTVAVSGLQVLQGISAGRAAQQEAEAEADFASLQAQQEGVQARREQRDLREETRRQSARTRAVLAAQGVDLSSATALTLQSDVETEADIRSRRLAEDSRVRQGSLRTRAANLRTSGKTAKQQSIFGGITRGAATATSLFPRRTSTSED